MSRELRGQFCAYQRYFDILKMAIDIKIAEQ